jgi:hypothetical protein
MLRELVIGDVSPEVRRRIEHMLTAIDNPGGAIARDNLRRIRAIEVLEHIGSASARALVSELSKGEPHAVATREAQAALSRWRGGR